MLISIINIIYAYTCIFIRSIVDQLDSIPILDIQSTIIKISNIDSDKAVAFLRSATANFMRSHINEFLPFLNDMDSTSMSSTSSNNDEDKESYFTSYCNRIECMQNAEWGGQVELNALASLLQRQIFIYAMNVPILRMGELIEDSNSKPPIRLTYHKHFYTLGEHYNSTMKI